MQVTRRSFLQGAIAAGFTFAVANNGLTVFAQKNTGDLFPIPVEVYSQPLFSITALDFEQLIGQSFSLTSADGQVRSLILSEVKRHERLTNSIGGTYGEGFSLIFGVRGKQRTVLPQDVYRISGGSYEFDMLVVPVGRDQREYEVVVNRLSR